MFFAGGSLGNFGSPRSRQCQIFDFLSLSVTGSDPKFMMKVLFTLPQT